MGQPLSSSLLAILLEIQVCKAGGRIVMISLGRFLVGVGESFIRFFPGVFTTIIHCHDADGPEFYYVNEILMK